MKKRNQYILVIVLIILNIFLLVKLFKINNQSQRASEFNKQLFSRDTLLISNLRDLLKCNYIESVRNYPIFNSIGNDRVVLYVKEGACGSCIQELLNYMAQLGDIIGKDKLLLLGNFRNENDFIKYANDAAAFVENSVFCNDISFLKEIDKKPAVFIITKNSEVRLFYIPDYFPGFKETYFTNILPSYFIR